MRKVWAKVGLLGPVSMAFGSMLWSQKKTESDGLASSVNSPETNPGSAYELKLVQVLFRHGARTPLKSIPDVMEVKLPFLCFVSSFCNNVSKSLRITWCGFNDYPVILWLGTFVLSKVQWVPTLLEPPAHTHINFVVTDLQGGPKPPAPVEDSYRKNTLTVSRCVLWCQMQSVTCYQPVRETWV